MEKNPMKRFTISKPYEGDEIIDTPWGKAPAKGMYQVVEEYDDEYTARVRVAVLNHGLPEKKFILEEDVGDNTFEMVDTDDDDE
jgi:hypothetical protein